MNWWLALPFALLILATLGVAATNVFGEATNQKERPNRGPTRLLLLAATPLGFLASSLGCSGLELEGCSSFCTFVKLVWIPLIAIGCVAYALAGRRELVTMICLMSFVPLFPHCVCYNVGNAWWIDLIGASPVCYAWGFAVSVVGVAVLRQDARPWPSLAVSFIVIGGATGFFVSHHYFKFPW
ncbi:MAG TPA: hypothetical protein VLM38_21600 [Blastocatellia bacterium]|nr:hypothetical protein [Blastocatellia bacterium]